MLSGAIKFLAEIYPYKRSFQLPFITLLLLSSCVTHTTDRQDVLSHYQQSLVLQGPQERTASEGLEDIKPVKNSRVPDVQEKPMVSGKTQINLALEDAVLRVLAGSPEIKVVSYDPTIAEEGITAASAEFDVSVFGQVGYDKDDYSPNDVSDSGLVRSSQWEAGIKQKGITGAEWSLAYAMTRSRDSSVTRIFTTAYEPTLTFELRQPLLRDAWMDVNLADVNIAKLNYDIAFASFRQRAEDVSTQLISLYWGLSQSRRTVEVQRQLLDRTIETLKKVEDRKNIDATLGDIKQAEASLKSREAALLEDKKKLADVQDRLVRLMADHQINLLSDIEIIPATVPDTEERKFDQESLLQQALENNPEIIRAQLEVDVADINLRVAERQKMPRLDFVASTELQGLSDSQNEAREIMSDGDFASYAVGLTLEYPLGNRERSAEYRQRKLRQAKGLSNKHNVSDKIMTLVKERIRLADTAHREITVQRDAVNAARIYLQSLEDIETIRKKLTPEFLLAKIQAQEAMANAQKAEIATIVQYNIALTRLAQATGTVLDMQSVKPALLKTALNGYPALTFSTKREEPPAAEPVHSGEPKKTPAEEETIVQLMDQETAPEEPVLLASLQPVRISQNSMVFMDEHHNTTGPLIEEKEPLQVPRGIGKKESASPIVPDRDRVADKERTKKKNYYVQAGAWKNADYAQEYLMKLRKNYPEAFIRVDNNFNKVRIPGIVTKEQGRIICEDIVTRLKLKPILIARRR